MSTPRKPNCRHCGELKIQQGRKWVCPPCKSAIEKARYRSGEQTRRQLPEVKAEMDVRRTSWAYGVSMEEARALRSTEACEVCGRTGPGSLHVDHDHKTGKVRGVLCRGCNITLGYIEDMPERLRMLANYLEERS